MYVTYISLHYRRSAFKLIRIVDYGGHLLGTEFHENPLQGKSDISDKVLRFSSKVPFIIDLSRPNIQVFQATFIAWYIRSFRNIPRMDGPSFTPIQKKQVKLWFCIF
jgi:hypothetical protein